MAKLKYNENNLAAVLRIIQNHFLLLSFILLVKLFLGINAIKFIAGWMPCHWQEVVPLQGCCWLPSLGQEELPLQGSLCLPLQEICWMPSPWGHQVPCSGPRKELQLHRPAGQVPDNC